jgi:hypothetical protein
MQTSWRILFLIVVTAEGLHFAVWQIALIVAGYSALEGLDHWLAKRARTKAIGEAIDYSLYGWENDPDDPTLEEKGEWSRIKLTGQDQIVVGRVAELLRQSLRLQAWLLKNSIFRKTAKIWGMENV